MKKLNFKYGVDEKPKSTSECLLLSIQHVFAMFGSTILVPTLIGIDISTSLFTAGIGTLIYSQITQKKVPVFIGSSFAYVAILSELNSTYGANGVANAVMSVGIIYIIVALIIKIIGTNWIDTILPPIVIGPTIIVIGLGLAPTAIQNSGFNPDSFDINSIIIALSALISSSLFLLKGPKVTKLIPIILGIITGYLVAIILNIYSPEQIIDTSLIFKNGLIHIPNFQIPYLTYDFSFNISIFLSVLPLVLVTLAEHIGDHSVSSSMLGKNFLKDPGLKRTILGDGCATLFAGFMGGVVNTTYAENTGVIIMTRVASIYIIRLAALFAILLAFIGPISGFIQSIPISVMGGISILLFGMIAQNGIRILADSNIDIAHPRNLIIGSVILVMGLGNAGINFTLFNINFSFSQMSLAALFGIIFHLLLPEKSASYTTKKHSSADIDSDIDL